MRGLSRGPKIATPAPRPHLQPVALLATPRDRHGVRKACVQLLNQRNVQTVEPNHGTVGFITMIVQHHWESG